LNYLEKSMQHLLKNPDHQPKHKVGLYPDGIFFLLDKHPPVSINDYKKLHFARVAQYRQMYKSAIDYLLLKILAKNNFTISDKGIKLINPIFEKCEFKWRLGFKEVRLPDNGNYTQKILQDAIVDCGIIKDDNYTIVEEDATRISSIFGGYFIGVMMIGKHSLYDYVGDCSTLTILELNDDQKLDIIVKE